jgi:ring-1,2-phenylacetyl-CoA epoxidase subunit PaaD
MEEAKQIAALEAKEQEIWKVLEQVPDPEIPKLSVVDLGIITKVELPAENHVKVTMTPTFSGCPAINFMKQDIQNKLQKQLEGYTVEVIVDFETQWSSNRITEKGLEILKNFGLAPPKRYKGSFDPETLADVACPHCGSKNTTMNSPFGPTLCRAIHYCFDCKQGFEQFKPL